MLRTFQSFQPHRKEKFEITFNMFTETEDINIDRWISLSWLILYYNSLPSRLQSIERMSWVTLRCPLSQPLTISKYYHCYTDQCFFFLTPPNLALEHEGFTLLEIKNLKRSEWKRVPIHLFMAKDCVLIWIWERSGNNTKRFYQGLFHSNDPDCILYFSLYL